MASVDTVAATELYLFIENDGDLYRQQHLSIIKNLVLKIDRGVYNHELAIKLYGYLVENGAKKYTKQFAGTGDKWNDIFNKPTREAVAKEFVRYFETEYKLGAYDNLHMKKYSGKGGALKNPSAKRKVASYSFDVYLNGKRIDTIYMSSSAFRVNTKTEMEDDVKWSLINHDGYDSGIKIRRRPAGK